MYSGSSFLLLKEHFFLWKEWGDSHAKLINKNFNFSGNICGNTGIVRQGSNEKLL